MFAGFPRIRLTQLPTPLYEMTRLSAALGGPKILVKRDDLTGLVLGGNKSRKLEFELAEAKRRGCDVVITTGASQSNHAGQTAAAAGMVGLDCILVLSRGEHPEFQGNQLIDGICDAEVITVEDDESGKMRQKAMDDTAEAQRQKGRNPWVIPAGASTPLGALGYVNAVSEICQQLNEKGMTANYLFNAVGSCGTLGGLVAGAKIYGDPFQVVAVSVGGKKEPLMERTANLANDIAKLLKMRLSFAPSEINIYDEYTGPAYGVLTPECIAAIKLVAKTEGIMLDPVYTGKAMAGMIDLIKKGKYTAKDTVIFLHTGGAPGLFAYAEEFAKKS